MPDVVWCTCDATPLTVIDLYDLALLQEVIMNDYGFDPSPVLTTEKKNLIYKSQKFILYVASHQNIRWSTYLPLPTFDAIRGHLAHHASSYASSLL